MAIATAVMIDHDSPMLSHTIVVAPMLSHTIVVADMHADADRTDSDAGFGRQHR
ncbi:MAG TPA: hypothetical protein VG271_14835 [Beijerinckiaceae bacterium]|jgi:hypothetical protein|nr:hypothetical protein [Beijerinckiaceae bacterium]